jgi:hypothetical protein
MNLRVRPLRQIRMGTGLAAATLLLTSGFGASAFGRGHDGGENCRPPRPQIEILSPVSGASLSSEPVTISIKTRHIAHPGDLGIRLNGVDITGSLSAPDSKGVRMVEVSRPGVNFGKNQLQVRYNRVRENSTFTLDTAPGVGTPVSGAPLGSELFPITTRVLGKDANGNAAWGIQVGTNFYAAQPALDQNGNPCTQCYGFQLLILDRRDPTVVVSNKSYETIRAEEVAATSPLVEALASAGAGPGDRNVSRIVTQPPTSGCQPLGCMVVMQSLAQIGFAPCYNTDASQIGTCSQWIDDPNVYNFAYWLTKLGGSSNVLFANGSNPHVGYSLIGNGGSGNITGTGVQGTRDSGQVIISAGGNQNGQFERLGCLDTRFQNPATICDSLGRAGAADNAGGSTDPQQAGRISGALVRDNYNLYTFTENSPQISYTFGTTVANNAYTNVVSIGGATSADSSGYYAMTMPSTSKGGFRLLILNRTHPDWPVAKQLDKFYDFPTGLAELESDINSFQDSNGLFFLASMGNIQHDIAENSGDFDNQWEQFVQTLAGLGADPMTVRVLGYGNAPAFDPDGKDDYLLVGKTEAYSPPVGEQWHAGLKTRYTAQESGYVISRHTLANATSPTQVEGVLVPDHQGYYTPHLQSQLRGLVVPQVTAVSDASLLPATVWPYSAQDTKATAGEVNAYNYISNELCCTEIRSNYTNLNISPVVWLTELSQLTAPTSAPTCAPGVTCWPFDSNEFTAVRNQLETEFVYLDGVRNLQNNFLSLYQNQQSNVGLILQQAASDIKADVDVDDTAATSPSPWSVFTSDVVPVLSNLAGFFGPEGTVAYNALGIGSLVIDNVTDRSNDASGVSQTMHALAQEEVAVANLAQHEADQYVDSLATLGNDFKRIVNDWGRLQTVGGPIATGQLVWDPSATSIFLRAFDLATRRQFYPTLMRSNPNFFVTRVKYGDVQYDGRDDHNTYENHEQCDQSRFHVAQDNLTGFDNEGEDMRGTAWWPGVQQVSNGGNSDDPHHPPAYWWDIWALGLGPETNNHCPIPSYGSLPSTYGMFDPVAADDAYQTNGLGLWKPYILQYTWTPQVVFNSYYGGSVTP